MAPVLSLALRILLLTGVRSGELRRAEWNEIDWDEKTWTIPPAHQKRSPSPPRVPWVVPLTEPVLRLFRELEEIGGALPYLLPSPGQVKETGCVAKSGEGLAPTSHGGALRCPGGRAEGPRRSGAAQAARLRRTVRTGLARLGVRHEAAERCLNHAVQEMEAACSTHDYLDERREALERWAAHVEAVVHGPPGKAMPKLRAVR